MPRQSHLCRIFLTFLLLLCANRGHAAVNARYVRVDNPTGFVMEWRQIQIFSGGQNVVLHHPEMVTGTVPVRQTNTNPTPQNIIVRGEREANEVTNGDTDTSHRASAWQAYTDPVTNANYLNPWFEVDLGKEMPIEKIVLFASRYPATVYLDKGHRVASLLGQDRQVLWAAKWQYYDQTSKGIWTFEPQVQTPQTNPVAGTSVPDKAPDWVAMSWLLGAEDSQPPADAAERMTRFATRNSPQEVEKLARRFFAALDARVPELAEARRLYAAKQYQAALDAWKIYWFAKMARLNRHVAIHGDYVSYTANGDDLLAGVMTTITPGEARAIHFKPGQIYWINLPADDRGRRAAMEDSERKAQVGKTCWPLLYAYRAKPDKQYLQRWAEIMDDWSLNFFEDAAKSPYEVENLFTFSPAHSWGTMMEDLSDIAGEHPELVQQIPATTLARVQLLCLEKYSTAWWRQTRETVFNHVTGGLYSWSLTVPYIQEFYAGQRAERELQQGIERWMTLGTERDGSMTEIGDDGHMEMPLNLGYVFSMWDKYPPAWYTPAWRNRALEWHDGTYKYMLRHLAPGGYEHRFAVGYRPQRWTSTWQQYLADLPSFRLVNRDVEIFGIPEVRRMLDAFGHVSSGVPAPSDPLLKPIAEARQKSHDAVLEVLGNEKPGAPHINSDWMPYTGAYYFRGSWQDDAPFLAMMACGSHGGSQAPQWPYGMIYHYDFGYPLIAAQPVQVDGLPPQQLYGRMNTFQPGTKTMALTNADEKPAPHRWLSDEHFDFGEAIYHGAYQKFPGFKGDWDGAGLEQMDAGKAVTDVTTSRQILQLRGSRLFIVTDAIQAPDNTPHEFSIPYKFSLSAKQKNAAKPFSAEQLQINEKDGLLRSDNPDGPSLTLYQFADTALHYQRGPEAKVDTRAYSSRLTGDIGIADQPVNTQFKGSKGTIVSLLASRDAGAPERIKSIESLKGDGTTGFHAVLLEGGEVWYQSAALDEAKLTCGPGLATGQALLVASDKTGLSGIVLGGKSLSLNGKAVTVKHPDFEFVVAGTQIKNTNIYTPIDPVTFLPNRNTFVDSENVQMVSKTPNVEIRYTADGTPPTRTSKLYTGPVKIVSDTTFSARAYRLGDDGKPLDADDFEINGTKFALPGYGWFTKKPMHDALPVAETTLAPGLNYELLQAPWWTLYANAHWLPANGGGVAAREMDLSKIASNEPYAVRYKGYIRIPQDGLYTFQAPHELVYMDNAASYDLRAYVDDEEWYLTQWWHGHGTWTVPLKKGLHTFQVDFADARTTPWRKSGIWRYYPRPWSIYQGKPSDILLSGPNLTAQRIPQEWLLRKP